MDLREEKGKFSRLQRLYSGKSSRAERLPIAGAHSKFLRLLEPRDSLWVGG